jgi:hypothetical protein
MVVSGRVSEARLSQVAPAADACKLSMFIKMAAKTTSASFIGPPFKVLGNRNEDKDEVYYKQDMKGDTQKGWGRNCHRDSVRPNPRSWMDSGQYAQSLVFRSAPPILLRPLRALKIQIIFTALRTGEMGVH